MNNLILKAIEFAYKKHTYEPRKPGDEWRKNTNKDIKVPYITHPLDVMNILLIEQGHNSSIPDEVIIAGVLHDTREDTKTSFDELEKEFGLEVAQMVEDSSEPEDLKKDPDQKGTWRKRKEHTIEHLKKLDKNSKLISCADKLQNARSMKDDLTLIGDKLWERFNAPKEDIKWYYESCLDSYKQNNSIKETRVFRLLKNEVEIVFG
tara:strand:+ start:309 stop:926 length:618 start_codon:yes stop_codon:yes gene_type:complete